MTRIVELVQEIAQKVLDTDRPMEICYGVVDSLSPLKIRISQKVVISGSQILKPSSMSFTSEDRGKTVFLLRNRKGQQYYILSRK